MAQFEYKAIAPGGEARTPEHFGLLLDPAVRRKGHVELVGNGRQDPSLAVEDDDPGARGSLVDGHDVRHFRRSAPRWLVRADHNI